jgi:hypothetical protein
MKVAAPTKDTKSTSGARSLRLGSRYPTSTTSRQPTPTAMTNTNSATAVMNLTRNQILNRIYRSGDEVRRIVEQEVADHALSAPCDGLIRGFATLSKAEVRRITNDVLKRLAQEHAVDKALVVVSLRFANAVDLITKLAGKHGRATVMSSTSALSLEQIIRLSRGSPETVHTRLRLLRHKGRR